MPTCCPGSGRITLTLFQCGDYARLERAVADALRETVGPDEARVLESRLLSRYRPPFKMPPPKRAAGIASSFSRQLLIPCAPEPRPVPLLPRPRDDDAHALWPNDGWTGFQGGTATTDLIDILDT